MAEDGWGQVSSRREKRRVQDDKNRKERLLTEASHRLNDARDLSWFNASHSQPTLITDEYDRNHAQLYGEEERMANGKHRSGIPELFPPGSPREIAHSGYEESTTRRDRVRKSYVNQAGRYGEDIERLPDDQRKYYKHATGSLFPTQHADLSDRALDYADASRR